MTGMLRSGEYRRGIARLEAVSYRQDAQSFYVLQSQSGDPSAEERERIWL